MKKRVLVTGGTGFIGRHVLPVLIEAGYEVHCVHNLQGTHSSLRDIVSHQVNLLDADAASRIIDRVRATHLLHLAWYVRYGEFWTSLENSRWVEASLSLLRAFAQSGGSRCVTAGTCAEYDWTHAICIEESTPCRPATLYGACKHALQLIQTSLSARMGISSAWGRIFHLYGPFEEQRRLVPSVILALLHNKPAVVHTGNFSRDFLHVADVARAFVALLDSSIEGTVNIGSGSAVTHREVAEKIAALIGRSEKLSVGTLKDGTEPPVLLPDTTRLYSTGFRPFYTLDSGLADTVSWWRSTQI
jgi:nucleoside-diphosphate-sugar epimerase